MKIQYKSPQEIFVFIQKLHTCLDEGKVKFTNLFTHDFTYEHFYISLQHVYLNWTNFVNDMTSHLKCTLRTTSVCLKISLSLCYILAAYVYLYCKLHRNTMCAHREILKWPNWDERDEMKNEMYISLSEFLVWKSKVEVLGIAPASL